MQTNGVDHTGSDQPEPLSVYEQQWIHTWDSFNRALRSPDDFNAFTWLFRLAKGFMCYLYFKSGLYKLRIHRYWRSGVPAFGISLICVVLLSYYFSLRTVIIARWCCPLSNITCHRPSCPWAVFHDGFVFYVGVMIIFHYISACFRSPGVALTADYDKFEKSAYGITEDIRWKSIDSQGGCCCFGPNFDIGAERHRVSKYKNLQPSRKSPDNNIIFPSIDWTECQKCRISRPPRCHHCSVCNRCILRFDHHCVWLNNCIGQNNYRNFLSTLLFLTIGCFYGVLVLWLPFCEPLQKQVSEHGWHFLYENKTGFLNLPPPGTMVRQCLSTGLEQEVVIKLVFPLLVSVGLLQAVFLSYHIRYTMLARTTLEYKILLERQYEALVQRNEIYPIPHNPFDCGWIENARNVLGSTPVLIFLPIPLNLDVDCQVDKKDT